ncbi:hypothetical protein AGOR_G00018780 [Albula goreensis]|uniref:Nuclear pore glycoprotein p62 n=1 Tax=Albula goreensis TaxID=1534307 RepID=A0A8T3E353_9TELE|nr:hypothetical protein AGOR_G00018780 [Albula goreensis]
MLQLIAHFVYSWFRSLKIRHKFCIRMSFSFGTGGGGGFSFGAKTTAAAAAPAFGMSASTPATAAAAAAPPGGGFSFGTPGQAQAQAPAAAPQPTGLFAAPGQGGTGGFSFGNPAQGSAAGGGFSFGANAAKPASTGLTLGTATPSSGTAFTLGGGLATQTTAAPAGGGFAFGTAGGLGAPATQAQTQQPAAGGFSLGCCDRRSALRRIQLRRSQGPGYHHSRRPRSCSRWRVLIWGNWYPCTALCLPVSRWPDLRSNFGCTSSNLCSGPRSCNPGNWVIFWNQNFSHSGPGPGPHRSGQPSGPHGSPVPLHSHCGSTSCCVHSSHRVHIGNGCASCSSSSSPCNHLSCQQRLNFIIKPLGAAATSTASTAAAAPSGTTTFTTGLKPGLPAATGSTAVITGTTTSTTAAASAPPVMSYAQLEALINKWSLELEDQERHFLQQATQVNAWDRMLLENGERITSLHREMEKVKLDQRRLDQELDFILSQQKELEDLLSPLEESVKEQSGTIYMQNADEERERTYKLAENVDGQLKRMSQDLKEIIEHLNTSSGPADTSDPLQQICKILNAHMDSLQWIDQNSVLLQRRVEEVSKLCDNRRKEQEKSFRITFE